MICLVYFDTVFLWAGKKILFFVIVKLTKFLFLIWIMKHDLKKLIVNSLIKLPFRIETSFSQLLFAKEG